MRAIGLGLRVKGLDLPEEGCWASRTQKIKF